MSHKFYKNKCFVHHYDTKTLNVLKRCQSLKLYVHAHKHCRLFFISAEPKPAKHSTSGPGQTKLTEQGLDAGRSKKQHVLSKTLLGHIKKTLAWQEVLRISKMHGCVLMLTEIHTTHVFKTKWQLSLAAAKVCPRAMVKTESKTDAQVLNGLVRPNLNHTLLGVLSFVPNYAALFISADELAQATSIKNNALACTVLKLVRKPCLKSHLFRALLKKSSLLIDRYTKILPV